MMDRYLFRGKRTVNSEWLSEWVEGHLEIVKHYAFIIERGTAELNEDFYSPGWKHRVYSATVGQCTGLKDQDGKLMFEGDIVQFALAYSTSEDDPSKGVVFWNSGAFWVDCTAAEGDEGLYSLEHVRIDSSSLEVIGNKYDNPELIEVSHD